MRDCAGDACYVVSMASDRARRESTAEEFGACCTVSGCF